MATNPRQIEAFRAVMTRQTVTSAAEALGISQPAVSRLIRDLELHSGVQLFARQGRQLIPTDAAQLLHAEVERIDLGMRRLEQFLADLRQRRRGDLRIAALPSMATEFLPRFLAGTADRLRPTRLYLDGLPSRLVRDAVESGRAKSASPSAAHPEGWSVGRACFCKRVMVLPRGHRLAGRGMITAAEIRGEQLVYLASRSVFDSSLRARCAITSTPVRSVHRYPWPPAISLRRVPASR
ncbi:MAG: LysR family transcriptional regulator [Hyphomicrobiaceae bacterium]